MKKIIYINNKVIILNLKKMVIVNSILTFLLCFLTHFGYDIFPNYVTAIFFPVNESIWEHMKMLYTTILLESLIAYFIIKKYKLKYQNFWISSFTKALMSIPIYLIMFLPFYYTFGENMPVTFIILFITILLVNILDYFILTMNPILYEKEISIIFIILVYIFMAFLTFKTPRKDLFFDTEKEKYGLNDYLISKN